MTIKLLSLTIVYIARNLCQPNPCGLGKCSLTNEGKINCNCKDTFTKGERCHIHYIKTNPVPILTVGNTHTVQVMSSINKIFVTSNNNNSLSIIGSPILNMGTVSLYRVLANQPGFYKVSYSVILPSVEYPVLDSTVFLVFPSVQHRSTNQDYFDTLGLPKGHLGIGCCDNQLNLTPHQCVTNITLYSSCKWTSTSQSDSSEGIIYLRVNTLYLPLSIVGIQVNKNGMGLYTSHQSYTTSSGNCASCSGTGCHRNKTSIRYNMETISNIVNYDSLFTTFLRNVRSFLPSWLSVVIHTTRIESIGYSQYNFMSSVSTTEGCDELPNIAQGLQYTIKTTSRLLFTISQRPILVLPTASNPFCVVVDMCSDIFPVMYAPIPSEIIHLLPYLTLLQSLLAGDTEINYKWIALQEQHSIQVHNAVMSNLYWNGTHRFTPSTPDYYEFKLAVNFTKTFNGGNNLKVLMKFEGDVYHQSNIKYGQVLY